MQHFVFLAILKHVMETHIIYVFANGQLANRFLNALKVWDIAQVQAKLYRGAEMVKVSYCYSDSGFDSTSSELDDLAVRYDGHEISDI